MRSGELKRRNVLSIGSCLPEAVRSPVDKSLDFVCGKCEHRGFYGYHNTPGISAHPGWWTSTWDLERYDFVL